MLGDVDLDKRATSIPKRSKAGKAADALANVIEDTYPEGKPYASAVNEDPEPKPRSISKNSTRSQ